MRLALGKEEFKCLVVLKNGAYTLAEALSLKLYDLGWLMKAWLGCFLSARIRSSSALWSAKRPHHHGPRNIRTALINTFPLVFRQCLSCTEACQNNLRAVPLKLLVPL